MANISNIESKNGNMELMAPGSQSPLGLSIEFLPPDHPTIKKLFASLRDKQKFLSQKGRPMMTADELRASRELITAAAVGWTWGTDSDGEPGEWNGEQPEFSITVLQELLAVDWVREQCDDFLADKKNFFTR